MKRRGSFSGFHLLDHQQLHGGLAIKAWTNFIIALSGSFSEETEALMTILSKTSIIIDATKYIEELKQKVERLNQDIALEQTSAEQEQDSMAMKVTVETLDKGFLVNVFSEKSSPGMLVSILEAFEELGLSVIEAKASCTDSFHLEAVGGELGIIERTEKYNITFGFKVYRKTLHGQILYTR
ncbi:hypothetical protein ACLOJK_023225 [Asimina triloba]